jgi:hypothetical protein
VVLQAVSHGAVAASPKITRTVASFLRINTPSLRARNETGVFCDGSIGAGSIARETAQVSIVNISIVNMRQRMNGLIVFILGKKSLPRVTLFPNITGDLPETVLHQVRGHKVGYRCVWHATRRVLKLERGAIQIKSAPSPLEARQSFGPTAA